MNQLGIASIGISPKATIDLDEQFRTELCRMNLTDTRCL